MEGFHYRVTEQVGVRIHWKQNLVVRYGLKSLPFHKPAVGKNIYAARKQIDQDHGRIAFQLTPGPSSRDLQGSVPNLGPVRRVRNSLTRIGECLKD